MARDILPIPVVGTLVERVFNYARDVCDYRRNQLIPSTIRSIMLVSYRSKADLFTDRCKEVFDTTDTTDMSEEEITAEWKQRVDEITEKLDIKFIPDLEPNPPLVANRTHRNQYRTRQRKTRRSRYHRGLLELGAPKQFLDRNLEAEANERAQIQKRNNEVNSSIFDPPESTDEETNEREGLNLDSESDIEEEIDELDTDLIDRSPLGHKRRNEDELNSIESRKKQA
jgi:hypothetical protein